MQGGLEIPVQVIVKMEYSPQNKDALLKYESLIEQYYKQPVDGKFDDVTDTVLKGLESDADEETDDEGEETVDIHNDVGAEDMEQAADTQ